MGYVRRSAARTVAALALSLLGLALPLSGAHAGHYLDHAVPGFSPQGLPSAESNDGGPAADWKLLDTIATGNPHTDLDFFTRDGEFYASVGTLAIGPNVGGQTIVQLTRGGAIDPQFLSAHPSANCLSNPEAALGLQHDVEATPKGNAILNGRNPSAVRTDTQLLIDATDAAGRCHDQGVLGIEEAPQGGLEIIDVTDPANPVEIGLISHIGEAHTVNIDPKRPHIAYAVTADAISVSADGKRANEDPASSDRFDLDGFEVVDLSSCMNFPPGTSVDTKRAQCRPAVYRYRYPTAQMALGHTLKTGSQAVFGCHELEVYPDDRLTCGSGNTLIALDMSDAFDNSGTPGNFSDDKPAGAPLPCQVRDSSSTLPFQTGAQVTDCVDGLGAGDEDLTIPEWLSSGSPSLQGVSYLGSIYHQGRGAGGAATPAFDSTQDIDFNHEAEYSASDRLLIATDERGGGVLPPGATCAPGGDVKAGNGGVHFYDADKLRKSPPGSPQDAFEAYAPRSGGGKAIFRAPIRTGPQAIICTAHVFHQIPGQNRIFMAWYSQGTRVLDFAENENGTLTLAEAGYFIPENANEWVSAVFKTRENANGTFTYWGATGDFNIGEAGRNAIDIYRVTLPPPPLPRVAGRCAKVLRAKAGVRKLVGSIGGDRMLGSRKRDRLRGRQGDDCIKGRGGRDRIKGESGRDLLKGGRHSDTMNGGRGRDRLVDRSRGRDQFKGGPGRDRIKAGGGGGDVVNCGKGRDRAVVDQLDRFKGCEKIKVRR